MRKLLRGSARGLGAWRVGCVLAGALLLVSCSDEVTGPSDLADGVWKLEAMELAGAPRFVPDDPELFTIEFHSAGRIGVMAECNQCGGPFSLRGDRLTVTSMACTLVACPTSRGEEFVRLIDGTSSLERQEDRLTIDSSRGRLLLTR